MTADLPTPDPKWLTDLRQDMRARILKLRAAGAPTDDLIEAASSLAEARMRPLQNKIAELELDLAALNSGRRYLPLSEVTDGHVRAYRRAYEDTMRGGPEVPHDECVRAGLAAIQWPAEASEGAPEAAKTPPEDAVIAHMKLVADSLYRRLDGITNQVRVLVESMPASPEEDELWQMTAARDVLADLLGDEMATTSKLTHELERLREVPAGMLLVPIDAVREVLDYEAVKMHSPCKHSWECTSEGGAAVLRATMDAAARPATPLPDIPDEAVDAAAKLLGYGSTEGEFREHVRRVLAAAAPFMVGHDPS